MGSHAAVASVPEVQDHEDVVLGSVLPDDPEDSYGQLQQAWRDLSCSLQVTHMCCRPSALKINLLRVNSPSCPEVLKLGDCRTEA